MLNNQRVQSTIASSAHRQFIEPVISGLGFSTVRAKCSASWLPAMRRRRIKAIATDIPGTPQGYRNLAKCGGKIAIFLPLVVIIDQ